MSEKVRKRWKTTSSKPKAVEEFVFWINSLLDAGDALNTRLVEAELVIEAYRKFDNAIAALSDARRYDYKDLQAELQQYNSGAERGCAACAGDPEALGRHVCGKDDFE